MLAVDDLDVRALRLRGAGRGCEGLGSRGWGSGLGLGLWGWGTSAGSSFAAVLSFAPTTARMSVA
eukprot:scaffold133334_cov66-Phaeocystis_antarctica.AAC.1